MEFTDQILKCVDCGEEFVFSAGEQLFFREKGFSNPPRHCKECKAKHTNTRGRKRTETRVTCSECGAATTVPFVPHMGRPVLCRSCFQRQLREAPSRPVGDKREEKAD
jgi:CxxC-x17-CxxC domain-containing protein